MAAGSVSLKGERLVATRTVSLMIAAFLSLNFFSFPLPSANIDSTPVTSGTNHDILGTFHSLDGYFTENRGQVAEGIRYYAEGNPSVGFRDDGVMFVLTEVEQMEGEENERWKDSSLTPAVNERATGMSLAYLLRFEGANIVTPIGKGKLPFKSNFFIGNDPSRWRTDMPNYRELVYENLYDGIDLVYRFGTEGLKYEFLVAPESDPGRIAVAYEGIEGLHVGASGELVVHTAIGDLRDTSPYAYHVAGEEVRCSFVLRGLHSFGFACYGYDTSRPLVIDPLIYSTFLGGSKSDAGLYPPTTSVTVDADGNAYVSGATHSADFPTTPGAFDITFAESYDVFVTKLNSTGSDLVYSTFLGGTRSDIPASIAIDSTGNAYIGGHTMSSDFPVTQGAFDETHNDYNDGFVAKLSADGSSLVYSTFLGGGSDDVVWSIAVDPTGNVFATGDTVSDEFPVTPGAYDTVRNGTIGGFTYSDVFVVKLNFAGSDLVFGTFLGGDGDDYGSSVAIDSSGNAYTTGVTTSGNFPTSENAFDGTRGGTRDVFVAKLNADGSDLIYGTYLGGTAWERSFSIAVDSTDNAYLTGQTMSVDFPTTPDAFDPDLAEYRYDAFVTKLNPTGSDLVYSTYLGGNQSAGILPYTDDVGYSIAVDSFGNAHVTGYTECSDFPTTSGAFQTTHNGGYADAFVTVLDSMGSGLVYSTFLGGSAKWDIGEYIALDSDGYAYVVGSTQSFDFPVTPDAFDTTLNLTDAFVTKLDVSGVVVNTKPTISSFTASSSPEGTAVVFSVNASDAEGDPLTYSFDFDSDGIFDVFGPNNIVSYVWGDDYFGVATVQVSDGRLGTNATTTVHVVNVAPSLSFNVVPSGNEGEALSFEVRATDPGSDDLTFSWWGLCDGWATSPALYPNDPTAIPDPYPSPDINPRNVADIQSVICGDDGDFHFNVQVKDDDGGVTTLNGSSQMDNLPPTLIVSPPLFLQNSEGISATLNAATSDPGSDDLTFTWSWEYGPTESHIYYNDGVGPDPPNSPDGTFPFTASDSSTHIYGDECLCSVTLSVEDDDGGMLTYITTLEVLNVPPILAGDIKAYVEGDFTLRVAGEKWHDVVLRLYDDVIEIANASVLRVPGNPDGQSATIKDVAIDLLDSNFSVVAEYTPLDDPVNGQIFGANPAWLIFTPHDGGEESRLHHTFNAKHQDTWTWTVEDFNSLLVGVNISFEATASDNGSDDLTFTWDWGDATSISTTYFNDGIGPDPYPSPNVNVITVTDVQKHTYVAEGSYSIEVSVEDDDGGSVHYSFDLTL